MHHTLYDAWLVITVYQIERDASMYNSFIHSFKHASNLLFNHPLDQSFNHSFIQLFNNLFIRSFFHPVIHSSIHLVIHLFIVLRETLQDYLYVVQSDVIMFSS